MDYNGSLGVTGYSLPQNPWAWQSRLSPMGQNFDLNGFSVLPQYPPNASNAIPSCTTVTMPVVAVSVNLSDVKLHMLYQGSILH